MLPTLPIELLVQVIEELTPPFPRLSFDRKQQAAYSEELSTLSGLTQTSRLFNSISTPFLYQSIFAIVDSSQYSSLIETLVSQLKLARLVRRLVLAGPHPKTCSELPSELAFQRALEVGNLLEHLMGLEHLTVERLDRYGAAQADVGEEARRVVAWSNAFLPLASCPNLRTLRVCGCVPLKLPSLLNLERLDFTQHLLLDTLASPMPCLTFLRVTGWNSMLDEGSWDALRAILPQLRDLDFSGTGDVSPPFAAKVLNLAPQLKRIKLLFIFEVSQENFTADLPPHNQVQLDPLDHLEVYLFRDSRNFPIEEYFNGMKKFLFGFRHSRTVSVVLDTGNLEASMKMEYLERAKREWRREGTTVYINDDG